MKMKSLTEMIYESMKILEEERIKSKKEFVEYAKNKFEIAFGDELDKDKMNDTINGILDDNKELVDKNEWGELIGILNKGFVKEKLNESKIEFTDAVIDSSNTHGIIWGPEFSLDDTKTIKSIEKEILKKGYKIALYAKDVDGDANKKYCYFHKNGSEEVYCTVVDEETGVTILNYK